MRVLLTGGAGFIGHHFVDHLLRETDANITILDRLDSSGNLNRLMDLESMQHFGGRVKVKYHNLAAPISDLLARQLGEFDRILHLAALTHVDRSIEDPLLAVQDNVVATCNILQFARLAGVGKFLYFSTDEVFGAAPPGVFYKEDDRYRSGNPYSATKAGGEELAVAFHNTYNLPVIVTHTMNVIGERQHPEKFVPMTISNVMRSAPVLIHADKTCTRPGSRFYIHAKRVAQATSLILDKGVVGEKYNIVGDMEMNNLDLASEIAGHCARPLRAQLIDFHSSRPGHDLRYALDGSKLAALGFKQDGLFLKDLGDVVAWSLKHRHWLR